MNGVLISVVVPCYNEEASLQSLISCLNAAGGELRAMDGLNNPRLEIILVDDGSTDGTLALMKRLVMENQQLSYVSFSRNFGKEAAMYAGMAEARGDYVCIIDADLQDSPSLLPDMCRAVMSEGFDCAAVRRTERSGEPRLRSAFARSFYRIMDRLCDIEVVDGARDYRLMTRQMTDSVLSLKEANRYSKGLFSWVGFKTKWFESENTPREAGKSKWSFGGLFRYAIDAIISFSEKPLAAASFMGILCCFLSFAAIVFTIVRQLVWGGSAYGWPSLVCIILFLAGIQLLSIGILGQYLAKMFYEIKDRPLFIIKEKGNSENGR